MPKIVIDIPVDIGTTVYEVHNKCSPMYMQCPFNGGYGYDRCNLGDKRYSRCKAFYEPVEFALGMEKCIGKFIFLTEQEAIDRVNKMNKSTI